MDSNSQEIQIISPIGESRFSKVSKRLLIISILVLVILLLISIVLITNEEEQLFENEISSKTKIDDGIKKCDYVGTSEDLESSLEDINEIINSDEGSSESSSDECEEDWRSKKLKRSGIFNNKNSKAQEEKLQKSKESEESHNADVEIDSTKCNVKKKTGPPKKYTPGFVRNSNKPFNDWVVIKKTSDVVSSSTQQGEITKEVQILPKFQTTEEENAFIQSKENLIIPVFIKLSKIISVEKVPSVEENFSEFIKSLKSDQNTQEEDVKENFSKEDSIFFLQFFCFHLNLNPSTSLNTTSSENSKFPEYIELLEKISELFPISKDNKINPKNINPEDRKEVKKEDIIEFMQNYKSFFDHFFIIKAFPVNICKLKGQMDVGNLPKNLKLFGEYVVDVRFHVLTSFRPKFPAVFEVIEKNILKLTIYIMRLIIVCIHFNLYESDDEIAEFKEFITSFYFTLRFYGFGEEIDFIEKIVLTEIVKKQPRLQSFNLSTNSSFSQLFSGVLD